VTTDDTLTVGDRVPARSPRGLGCYQHPGLHLLQSAIYLVGVRDVIDDADRSSAADLVSLPRSLAVADTSAIKQAAA